MKKLLVITDLYPHKYNPNSEVFVEQQVKELAKYYEIRVIATRFKYSPMVELEKKENYQVTYVFMPVIRFFYLSLLLFYRIYTIPVVRKTLSEWQPDLIHVHDYRHVPELLLLNPILIKYSAPRFLTTHNIRTHPIMVRSVLFKWFYGLCVKRAYSSWTHIFTVNNKIKDIICKDTKITAITNIGNAINHIPKMDKKVLAAYTNKLSDTGFKIISVGNLKQEKGFDILLRAVSILSRRNYNIQLMIIGQGSEIDKLTYLTKELNLTERIFFTGDLGNDLVRNLYPFFDAFVLPSYSETFGIVYIEAMYAGLPVVGVKGQGVDGIIKHRENGLLSEPRDIIDLARQIEFLISNPIQSDLMAKEGKFLVREKYIMSSLIDRIRDCYEQ